MSMTMPLLASDSKPIIQREGTSSLQRRAASRQRVAQGPSMRRTWTRHAHMVAAFAFGVVFIVSLIVLAIRFPQPTSFQYEIFKGVMALAAAGVASMIPGLVRVRLHGLVQASGAIGIFFVMYLYSPAQLVAAPSAEASGATYRVKETLYVVDLTRRVATGANSLDEPFSEVTVERRDRIRKVSDQKEDFTLFFGTSGLRVDWEPIVSPAYAEYHELTDAGRFRNPLKKSYNYVLHLGDMGAGYEGEARSRLRFWNAFQGEHQEWWASEIRYPTDKVIVIFIFPESKPSRGMHVLVRSGDSKPRELTNNPPVVTKDGRYAYWTGERIPGGEKYIFEFQW